MNKLPELRIRTAQEEPDLIFITETWTHQDITNKELEINGYNIIRREDRNDTVKGRGGGLLMYGNASITTEEKTITTTFNQVCAITLRNEQNHPFHLYLIYRSPNSSLSNDQELNNLISNISPNSMIFGDFNYPEIHWSTLQYPPSASKFVEACQATFLEQLVEFSTHIAGNTLDLVLTNAPEKVHEIEEGPPLANSDHSSVSVSLQFYPRRNSFQRKIWAYTTADWDQIRRVLDSTDWEEVKYKSVEEQWQNLLQIINEAYSYIPIRSCHNPQEPLWMTTVLRRMINKKKRAYRAKKNHPSLENDLAFRKVQSDVKYQIRRAKAKYEKGLAKNAKSNPKKFYQYINTKTKSNVVGPLTSSEGKTLETDEDQAEELNQYFASIFQLKTPSPCPSFSRTDENDTLSEICITKEAIKGAIERLDWNSSPGPDGISPYFLKTMVTSLLDPLLFLFRKSTESGKVPKEWKQANVTPVHKNGSKKLPMNYRPISLTSIIGKLLETILKNQIYEYIEENDIVPPNQHGFRSHHSCTTNLIQFFDPITKILDRGKPVDMIYFDFKKAFDLVPHCILITKLHRFGIRGKLLSWIQDWLIGRTQRVTLNGKESGWKGVTSGVVQGSVLGPVLFLLFVADLTEVVSDGTIIGTFADDTKIGRAIESPQDNVTLQHDIDRLSRWAKDNQMKFNIEKSKSLQMGRSNVGHVYTIDGVAITRVNAHRDLGVLISQDMKPSLHVGTIVKKANAMLGQIKRSFSVRSPDVFTDIYKAFVRPHLEFAVQAWSPWLQKDIDELEKVQKRAVRMISGIKGSYEEKIRDLGLTTLEERRKRGDAIQVFKFIKGMDPLPSPQLFLFVDHPTQTRGCTLGNMVVPKSKLDIRKYHFSVRSVHIWNNLPLELRQKETLNDFKASYDLHTQNQS